MGIVIERNRKPLASAAERDAANVIAGLFTIDGVVAAIGGAKHPDGITGVEPTVAQRFDHDVTGVEGMAGRLSVSVAVRGVRNQYGRKVGEQFTELDVTETAAGSGSYVIEAVTSLAGGGLCRSDVFRLEDANSAEAVEGVYRAVTEVVRASLTNTNVRHEH